MDVFGLFIPNWLVYITVGLIGIYIYLTWRFGELKALGIPHNKPLPLFGTVYPIIFKQIGMLEIDIANMKKFGKIWGSYIGREPALTIVDPDILKQILVKDFHNFVNRRKAYLNGIFKHGVFNAEGAHWKHIRTMVTPAFTSGKMKQMTRQMNECSKSLLNNMAQIEKSGEAFEAKRYTAAFTVDVIASIAFGLQLDTQKDPDNEFTTNVKKLLDFNILNPMVMIAIFLAPLAKVLDRMGCTLNDRKIEKYFNSIIEQTIDQRKEQKMSQNDFIQLLLDAEHDLANDKDIHKELENIGLTLIEERKGTGLTHDEILAQCLLFLVAGYETTATTLQLLLYNLATNQEIQEQAAQEVDHIMGDRKEMRYEDIVKLKYLDMCLDENLRMYPPVVRVDRRAATDVQYGELKIPKDFTVFIPIKALHMNPEVWPEPEKYNPDRFSPEAKAARNPYNYLPFGTGPRNCIGMRLAQMEIKIVMAHLLKRFRFVQCEETQVPLKLQNKFFIVPEKGVWLKIESR